MSLKVISSGALCEALRPVRRRPRCECINLSQHLPRKVLRSHRSVSSATSNMSEMEVDGEQRPRWSHTPPAMQAPIRSRLPVQGVKPLEVNSDPKKLDEVYIRFLGKGGHKLLSDETKWLAVTHKSFDHGRRGFNDRLAFLGKRIVELQTSLNLIASSNSSKYLKGNGDPFGREPFKHPAVDGVESLIGGGRSYFTYHKQISSLSAKYGIPDVVRWVPKKPDSLQASGADLVHSQVVFAIIGGLALEQGGAFANKIVKERILAPIGLRRSITGGSEQLQI